MENKFSPSPRLRVLLIDDDQDVRDLLKLTLISKFDIGEAENGMVGLAMLEKFEPDLVVCDVMMPVLNGLETVEAIRQHPRFFDLPVFFLSGEKSPALPQITKQLGGNLFLPKPIEPWLLMDLIAGFVKEMRIAPRERMPLTPAPQASEPLAPVRIVVMDNDAENVGVLKELLTGETGGRWETIWSVEPLAALGRLNRMEPDVILYNPRQKVMDGIALAKFIHSRNLKDQYEIAFVGRNFLMGEVGYSRQELGREPIRLDRAHGEVMNDVQTVIESARGKIKKKTHTVEELTGQERDLKNKLKSPLVERQAERDAQYQWLQNMIDQKCREGL